YAARKLQIFVVIIFLAWNFNILPEFFPQRAYILNRGFQAFRIALNSHPVPHNLSKSSVEINNGSVSIDAQQAVNLALCLIYSLIKSFVIGAIAGAGLLIGKVIADSIWKYKVTVGKALHKCTGTKAVGTVIRKISLSRGKKAGNGGLQVIINPQAAHC